MAKVKKVRSLFELGDTPTLQRLAQLTASNLGWDCEGGHDGAMKWLHLNAAEVGDEAIVDEVNFCRDLL